MRSRRFREVSAAVALIAVVAGVTLAAVGAVFHSSPDAQLYVRAGDHLVRLSDDAHEELRVLIDRDEVTWDPTNGTELTAVFTHLKKGRGDRVLLLGSSQLLVLRDDRSRRAFARRVDKVLERGAARPVTVYNLSLGGMSAPEKELVLARVAGAVHLDDVVVALTLWDSTSPTRRAGVNRLYTSPRNEEPFGASDDRSGPAAVNRLVTAALERALEEHVSFFRERAAIQAWIGDRVGSVFSGARPPLTTPAGAPPSPIDATPIQFVYSEEEIARAVANARGLLASTAALRDRYGFHVSILLTPFRQDARFPAYDPSAYARFRASVRESCERRGFDLVDSSELLDASHFGPSEFAETRGRIDVLHFDARGHEILAATLARAIGLDAPRLAANRAAPGAR
jgi:hypothetical protein